MRRALDEPERLECRGGPARPVAAVHLGATSITGACAHGSGCHPATTTRQLRHSTAYDNLIRDVVGHACTAAGAAASNLEHVVVGVSYASLHRSHMFRRIPTGPYWQDAIATGLEFQLATRVSVASAIELAALAESRHGSATVDRRFVLVQAGAYVEAGLFYDGRLRTGGIVGGPGHPRTVLARLQQAVIPLLRSSKARLVVIGGINRRRGPGLCADLRAALVENGVGRSEVVPTGLVGDPVIAGALHVAASGRRARDEERVSAGPLLPS